METQTSEPAQKKQHSKKHRVLPVLAVLTALLLVALTAAAVLGYKELQATKDKLSAVDSRLNELFPETPAEETATDQPVEEQGPLFEYEVLNQRERTVPYSTTFNQSTGTVEFEERNVLEVTLRITNNSGALFSNSGNYFAATESGELIPNTAYSIQEDALSGRTDLSLAPNGVGEITLYFLKGDQPFTSLFIEDYTFATQTSIEL